jgi:hypothetical protein
MPCGFSHSFHSDVCTRTEYTSVHLVELMFSCTSAGDGTRERWTFQLMQSGRKTETGRTIESTSGGPQCRFYWRAISPGTTVARRWTESATCGLQTPEPFRRMFKGPDGYTEFIASGSKMSRKLVRIWKAAVMASPTYLPGICLEEMRSTRNPSVR